MAKTIALANGKGEAIVDDDDYEYLSQFKWRLNRGYASHSISMGKRDGKRVFINVQMHRLINKTPNGMYTDHLNRDKLDNRKSNLRTCTLSQNQMNHAKRQGAVSKYKGVSFCKQTGKWKSAIRVEGRGITIGRFSLEDDAALAYNDNAKQYFGEFAYLNKGI
jgi:hypothetical protein